MATNSQPQPTITPLRKRPAWKALEKHYADVQKIHLRQLFAEDPQRAERFTLEAAGLYFDHSKNRITDETIRLLIELAGQSGLRERIDTMFQGEQINLTERRAVLDVALRAPKGEHIRRHGQKDSDRLDSPGTMGYARLQTSELGLSFDDCKHVRFLRFLRLSRANRFQRGRSSTDENRRSRSRLATAPGWNVLSHTGRNSGTCLSG